MTHLKIKSQSPFFTLLLVIFFLFSNAISGLQAQIATYSITVSTSSSCGTSWPDNCSTNNHIYMIMTGTAKPGYLPSATSPIKLKGYHDEGTKDAAFDYEDDDVGVISQITLYLGDVVILDPWGANVITIDRKVYKNGQWVVDGSSTFNVKRLIKDKQVSFNASMTTPASVSAVPVGATQYDREQLTKVNYAENFGTDTPQVGMQYTESWSQEKSIMVGTSTSNSSSAYANINYTSPMTVAGQFGGEIGGAIESTATSEEQSMDTSASSSSFDWSFNIPGNVAVFRKLTFEIPYGFQKYEAGGKSFIVRKLRAEIKPISAGDYCYIPSRENGKIVPVLLSRIENDFMPYIDPSQEGEIRRKLNDWIAKGWVVRSISNTNTNTNANNNTGVRDTRTKIDKKTSANKNKKLKRGVYRIKCKADNMYWHEDGTGDKLISTRKQGKGKYTRFTFIPQNDGSYRIRANGSNEYLRVASNSDELLSTRLSANDNSTRFILEKANDGSYRLKCKGNGKYLHLDGTGDKLVSTRKQGSGDYTSFYLEPQ